MALNQTFNQDNQGNIGVAAAVSTSAPSYTSGLSAALSLTLSGLLRVDGSGVTQPISASSLPLPTGASTASLQSTGNATLLSISGQLPASLGQKVSASSLAVVIASDQSALAVSSVHDYAQGASTSGEIGPLIQAAASAAAPSYSAATTNPLSLTLAGALRVDGSAVTQPVSAASLPLPSGAATSALQTAGNSILSTISGQLPAALGQTVAAGSISVVLASNQPSISVSIDLSSTAALTSVSLSTSSQVLIASNAARKGFILYNDSANMLFVAFAGTASTTAFTTKIQAGGEYDMMTGYTGAISGIASAASGAVRITEMT